jgi:hypothetical protein
VVKLIFLLCDYTPCHIMKPVFMTIIGWVEHSALGFVESTVAGKFKVCLPVGKSMKRVSAS